ncbi:hypothetical protein CNECB9_1310035 [Cupriavidus necator]|uniref:Uncharacterized protein n=1 Tax=Cupriavidus necator TaxID=106590 RepID=A0A1K0ILS6_CUPNE|nr:hypothetical protein CNECB9_1310035 [Cupriavidus necator]
MLRASAQTAPTARHSPPTPNAINRRRASAASCIRGKATAIPIAISDHMAPNAAPRRVRIPRFCMSVSRFHPRSAGTGVPVACLANVFAGQPLLNGGDAAVFSGLPDRQTNTAAGGAGRQQYVAASTYNCN